ncbi:lysophospholipase L1-like esterase [Cytobacillus eiseniae]|uniref:Lysophospholipase L1-like esterase n=1 Tax=Cytobacillus eiseniae TaxID=762947 RepID=A0ABS4RIS6_9BACI|nr:SGNH/GDSL hydrolase family protein [Cytobacillus eiseniae]MBP2242766.1 lysophospholipase L1-like esterase [Cytobacillus eiseniae]
MQKQFVAMGDSLTVGVGDEVEGFPRSSWVDTFAQMHSPPFLATNLAKRGLVTKEVRMTQLEKALTLQADLVSLITGANDILKEQWNRNEYKNEMEHMIDALSQTGATIIIGNMPDFTARLPIPTEKKQGLKEQLLAANEVIYLLNHEYKFHLIDFWNTPLAQDPSIWSNDRIHPNSRGYQEIAALIYHQVIGGN